MFLLKMFTIWFTLMWLLLLRVQVLLDLENTIDATEPLDVRDTSDTGWFIKKYRGKASNEWIISAAARF